jgi:hypothetical protein
MCIITDYAPPVHRPPASHRILYTGRDHTLLARLKAALPDCQVVRCPDAASARLFLKSDIPYTALLIDTQLPDSTGRELADFARSLAHRTHTPTHIIPPGEMHFDELVRSVTHQLSTQYA